MGVWWHMLIIAECEGLRQEDCYECAASLGSRVRKTLTQKRQREGEDLEGKIEERAREKAQ